jgi:hypothetical protein
MSLRTVRLWIAVLGAAFQMTANDNPFDRRTLRGLTAFNLVVDTPEPELQERGLSVAAVETEVEQRLVKAGLHVDKNASEFLGIRIIAAHGKKTDFALCIMLAVYQAVALKRDPTIASATPTWSVESVLLIPPRQFKEAWTDTIDHLVGEFVNAWQAANAEGAK